MLEKIKIGWKSYNIEYTEPNDNLVEGAICYGRIDYDKQKIYLNHNYAKHQQKATLIHEVLHGISDMYCINTLNEDTVTRLAEALYTLLIDNNLEIVKRKKEVENMKFRKKPVEIEAFQYDGDFTDKEGNYYIPGWAIKAVEDGIMNISDYAEGTVAIKTLEGTMIANVGDYIIQGVKGELYPCKADIFVKTYEPVYERDIESYR